MTDIQQRNTQLKAALADGDRYDREAVRLREAGQFTAALDAVSRARQADAKAARLLTLTPPRP